MKKFRFRFDTVLRVKEKKEEQLKHELFLLQAMKAEQEILLKQVNEERMMKTREKSSEENSGTDIQSLIYYEQHLNALRRKIAVTEKKIKELQGKVDIKRGEVVEASREKKIFEKIKDRDFDAFKRMIIANEQKNLDEIAVNKYNRKEQHNF